MVLSRVLGGMQQLYANGPSNFGVEIWNFAQNELDIDEFSIM